MIDDTFPGPAVRAIQRADLTFELCQDELEKAPALLMHLRDGATRQRAVGLLSSHWAQTDPQRLAAFALGSLRGSEQTTALRSAISAMLNRDDVAGALAAFETMPPSATRYGLIDSLAAKYAQHDLTKALAWGGEFEGLEQRRAAVRGVLSPLLSQRGIMGLVELANAQTDTQARRQCLKVGVRHMVNTRPFPEAATWVDSLAGDDKVSAQVTLLGLAAQHDLTPLRDYLLRIEDKRVRSTGAEAVVGAAAQASPEAAAQWAATLPDDLRQRALEHVASNWAGQDTAGAIAWADAQADGPLRDVLLERIATSQAILDFPGALETAMRISDLKKRESALHQVNLQRPLER